MDDNVAKGICIIIFFVLTIVFGCLPIWLCYRGTLRVSGSPRRKLIVDLFNCFAGGVFLGTCLLQILSEGREDLNTYMAEVHFNYDFPFYETLVGVGLFLVAIADKLGFILMTSSKKSAKDTQTDLENVQTDGSFHAVSTQGWRQGDIRNSTTSTGKRQQPEFHNRVETFQLTSLPAARRTGFYDTAPGVGDRPVQLNLDGRDVPQAHSKTGLSSSSAVPPSLNVFTLESAVDNGHHGHVSSSEQVTAGPRCDTVNGVDEVQTTSVRMPDTRIPSTKIPMSTVKDSHQEDMSDGEHNHDTSHIFQMSAMRALLLLLALSFHTLFDGLAVGLQSPVSDVWQVLIAVGIHKSLVSFCLGLELASSSSRQKCHRPILQLLFFSLTSPVGIGIGMAVTSGHVDELAQLLVSGVLQALATGTFLYVTFFEILGQSFGHSHGGSGSSPRVQLVKVVLAFVGFGAMGGLKWLDALEVL